MPDGVDPIPLVLLARVHVVHQPGHIVHRPSVLALPGLVVQVGGSFGGECAIAGLTQAYTLLTMRFLPIRFWTKRVKAWFIINNIIRVQIEGREKKEVGWLLKNKFGQEWVLKAGGI